ncbi:ribosome biogenesis protein SLX9-domain-containing protein [Tricharina praecox]|uniref:ribosome biogenesis protein SLX9-domain-containing protein n=1 Tax=Tricharina praecox TaxID=43433 RepID=UPI002220FCB7|nr:ribosome biogenesis protein SLX9-domain-containing protein [Tricharina praecox]KAI5857613.1 ribosome biogenesis protein SLX9-domain-containing protein [Tricharina praecox]
MGRATIRTKKSHPSSSSGAGAATSSLTPSAGALTSRNPKKSVRLARHADFISRIEKKAAPSKIMKRRRPKTNTALLGSIDSLAAALPEALAGAEDAGTEGAMRERKGGMGSKAIKSRPGAMVRKERLLKSECERFGKNLAILEGEKGQKKEGVVGGSWATLRQFIGATLEKKEEFVEMEMKAAEKAAGTAAMEVEV